MIMDHLQRNYKPHILISDLLDHLTNKSSHALFACETGYIVKAFQKAIGAKNYASDRFNVS
jgi:hypothetical protein